MELQTIIKYAFWAAGTIGVVVGISGLMDALTILQKEGKLTEKAEFDRNISTIIALLGIIVVFLGNPISAFIINLIVN